MFSNLKTKTGKRGGGGSERGEKWRRYIKRIGVGERESKEEANLVEFVLGVNQH